MERVRNMENHMENRESIYSWLPGYTEKKKLFITETYSASDIQNIDPSEKYDYIILDNVPQIFQNAEKTLTALKNCLAENGKLIFCVPNRIGAQYLSGRPDDCTKRYFHGINGYADEEFPKSLTQSEWQSLLSSCSLSYVKFFYPYPNQQYIKEIFTEGTFEQYQYGKPYINLSSDKFYLFNENIFCETLVKEGAAEKLANAFLIVAGQTYSEDIEEIRYIKLNRDRDERFQIGTLLKNSGSVEKYALTEKAEPHIDHIFACQGQTTVRDTTNLQGIHDHGKLIYPFLNAVTLDTLITDAISQKDKSAILNIFHSFYDRLYENTELTDQYGTEEFREVFGNIGYGKTYHCAVSLNIDLICDNIFYTEDQYQIIDCEWIFPFLIPVEFVIWRAINELYAKHQKLSEIISKKEFESQLSISQNDEELFLKWGSHFAYDYVKSDSVAKKAHKEIPISLESQYESYCRQNTGGTINAELISTQFICDSKNGYDGKSVLNAELQTDENRFRLTLAIPSRMGRLPLKWIPLPDIPCHIRLTKTEGFDIAGNNAAYSTEKNRYSFILGDAFFYLIPKDNSDFIYMEGDLFPLSVTEQRHVFRAQQRKEDELNKKLDSLKEELESLNKEKERLQGDLDIVLNSTIWRKTEPLRRMKDGMNKSEKPAEVSAVSQSDEQKPVEESFHSYIDKIILSEQMLSIDGWVLCENHKIEESVLILEDIFGIRHQYPFDLVSRKDVGDALQMRYEGECGIRIEAFYKSFCAQKIIINALVEGKWHEVDTQNAIPATDDAVEGDFFFERFRGEDEILDYVTFRKDGLSDKTPNPDITDWKADVIVPVYNGLQYLPKLFEGIEKTNVSYRLILIDDCSPDESVLPYLKEYASHHDNVILLENKENLGFVKSVNRALKMAEHHVALVNTDVELPANWLERLLYPIYADDKTASVTPFSNSATIYSFPNFDEDNPMFMGMTVDQIDAVFATIKPQYTETPTGVGFCLGMNYHVLQKIGILDEETFEKGYGEENDWCQRAIEAGYINVHAENLFVRHNHGGSFLSETKKRLLRENGEKLIKKHPNYPLDTEKYRRNDPNRPIREYVKFELMFRYDAPFILAFDHELGGGASDYLKQKMDEQTAKDKLFGIVHYNILSKKYCLDIYFQKQRSSVMFKEKNALVKLLRERKYEQIWINELATYVEIKSWMDDILKLRKENTDTLRLLIHDYFMLCPSLNLVNKDGIYCKICENDEICAECLSKNEFVYNDEYTSVSEWRKLWGDFIKECDEVIVFSEDSARIIQSVYSCAEQIRLIPHTVEPLDKVSRKQKKTSTCNIGILGAISLQKGLEVIRRMGDYIADNQPDMRIIIIGETAENIDSPVIRTTGRYKKKDVPKLTETYDIDAFLIPSVWPETFSYTTSEIMSMGMPLAVFDLGAPAERVKNYDKGLILPGPDMETKDLVDALFRFAQS